jgi:acetolactate synthase-1/2/3 large subunit
MNHSQTGAELIVHLLERQGVDLVAGIPGGAILPLYEALGGDTRVRHVLARHEQAAGFIAQGMARVSGKAGVCLATSGPGVTNLLTAIADAKLDSVPLVCISGQVPQHLIGTDAFQEVKTGHLVDSITKANFFARSVEDLLWMIPEAFRIAESGRPGPVLVDVPKDVQLQRIALPLPPPPSLSETAEERRQPTGTAWATAAAMINAAQKPVLYLGGGVVKSGGWEAARAVAEKAGLPTTTSLMALGSLPDGHPLALGMLGMHGAKATNHVLDECDLLIAVGARFDDRATGQPAGFCPQAQIIHIDLDTREFGKIKMPALALQADARQALKTLLPRLRAQSRPGWLARIAALRAAFPAEPRRDSLHDPSGLIAAVAELAGPEALISTDVGQHQMWVAQHYPFARPDRWLTSGGLGTMGFGLPAAIGAALARPDLANVCFTGDGSLLMNVQELATLAELDLPVKIVLLDNAALGLVRQQQTLFYKQRHVASHYVTPTDFAKVAEAFGIPAYDLGRLSEPRAALEAAFRSAGPALIRVPVDADRQVLPMVVPGRSNLEAIGSELVDTET